MEAEGSIWGLMQYSSQTVTTTWIGDGVRWARVCPWGWRELDVFSGSRSDRI